MLEIFWNMMKEEWRIHSSLFGGFMFALFPMILTAMAFGGSMFLPLMRMIIPIQQIWLIFQYSFVLFGLSVGSFGLFGREIMNRRFGHASLMAYSSRTLPVSEKRIFFNFFVKDIIYYFFLWILPFAVGFTFSLPFISASPIYSVSLLLTLSLSFLLGLSIAFFLSTIYAHSVKLLISIVAASTIILSVAFSNLGMSVSSLAVLLSFPFLPSASQIALSIITIAALSGLSLHFLKVDYPQKKKIFKNSLVRISNWFKLNKNSVFISKDMLDFNRSEGGLGKILFSFLIPLAFVWLLITLLLRFIPLNMYVVFSIFLGIISSSFYNWFTEFDSFTTYAFLPVKVSTLIKSKISSYILVSTLSVAILVLMALWGNWASYLLPSLITFVSVSSYALAVNIFLAGLNPNVLLYNGKIFLQYVIMLSPLLLALVFLSMLSPFYLMLSLFLVPVSYKIIRVSYDKWDRIEQPYF